MRILWLSHLVPYPPKGGVQQRSFNLLRELARYHDVTLLAFNQPALLPTRESVDAARTALSEFVAIEEIIDIRHDIRPAGRPLLALRSLVSPWPYSINWLQDRRYARSLQQALAQGKFDAMHFDTIGLAPYLAYSGNLAATLNHHNIESDMMLRRADLDTNPLKRFYYRQEGQRLQRFERQFVPRFALNATCSQLDGERLQALVPDIRYQVVPNGVDLDYFTPQQDLGGVTPNSALFAGGLAWYPNASAMQWFVTEIWPLVCRETADATMTIVGRRPPNWLEKRSSELGNVRVAGFVDDVRPYMEDAMVYVCPIFDGGGTKLKMLDAMAMGKAIVAHPVACEGIDIVPGVHAMTAEKPADFARAIKELWSNPQQRKALGSSARQLVVDKYSFAQIGREFADSFKRLGRDAAG